MKGASITIMPRVPAHTQIAARCHRDDRVATVIPGTWHIGYGDRFEEWKRKALSPGTFYTEPPGRNYFAETGGTRCSRDYRLRSVFD
jgi:hypothetical protein